jgi:glutamate racemase
LTRSSVGAILREMSNSTVCFLDSGIGGLPYLEAARVYLDGHHLVYLADREFYPFGTKAPEALRSHLVGRVDRLIHLFDPSCVVLACNTATVVALEELRLRFPVPFVGVVPAIKPAAERANGRGIVVLATSRTVQERYVADLVDRFAANQEVVGVESGPTVDFVEKRWRQATDQERLDAAAEALASVDLDRTDAVVLGCTHFVFLRPYMERLVAGKIRIVDSVDGVARQIGKVCEKTPPGGNPGAGPKPPDLLIVTGNDASQAGYRDLAGRFSLRLQTGL